MKTCLNSQFYDTLNAFKLSVIDSKEVLDSLLKLSRNFKVSLGAVMERINNHKNLPFRDAVAKMYQES